RLRYVFRHFPIGQVHRHAQHAAEAAEAAGAQGRFWDMHEALASRQRPLDDASLLSWAHELGLDTSLFLRDVATHVHADYIGRQVQGGIDSGVESTPAFFINGVRFEDEWQHGDALLRALEEAAVT
ncbi:MAG: hypothetical protein FJX72_21730, partial [Armatimonadetes bacterium]|nr:hypothetical protein [Armatimonadota bacterium]